MPGQPLPGQLDGRVQVIESLIGPDAQVMECRSDGIFLLVFIRAVKYCTECINPGSMVGVFYIIIPEVNFIFIQNLRYEIVLFQI